MTLGLGPALRQELRLECRVCLAALTTGEIATAAAMVALFGAAEDPYAVCPACLREIPAPGRADERFRLRVRRHYFARNIIIHQDASGRWLKRRLTDDADVR